MNKQDLYILMLEDDALDAELNKAQLTLLEEYHCMVDWVTDKFSYLSALQAKNYDIILSDYNLPQYNGLEALNDLKAKNLFTPFIFVTGTIDEETAAGTIKAGAWDYVVKDRLFRLPLAIRGALQLKEERINTAKAEAKNLQLSMAVEQSPVLVVICNIKFKIEYVNTRFTEITGFLPDEVIGKDIMMLFSFDKKDFFINLFTNDLTKTNNWHGEVQSLKKDGSLFWEHLSISPLKNEKSEITHYISVKEDITKRKQMEQELLEALDRAERSDKLKEAFLQNLSHEIRTPLNAIVGFSDLLNNRTLKSQEKIEEYTTIISNSSNKLLSIVSDVLTIASIQTGQQLVEIQQVDINKLFDRLHQIYLTLANNKKISFIIKKDKPDQRIYLKTDEIKLDQILTNLLNNAIKFTHSGLIELKYVVNENNIRFYVKDTGIGISKESQSIIFERFAQADKEISTNYGGTGLGLSISKSFAHMLGGTISVESELNKGSTFYLTLPYQQPEKEIKQDKNKEIALAFPSLEVLIAEDEIDNYLLLNAILSMEKITLYHAKNGLEAVSLCRDIPSINLVLMDIKMPVMDGINAFKEIKKIKPLLPVIAQTAYALEQEKQEFLNIGFDGYLSKPIVRAELLEKINNVMSNSTK